VKVAQSLLVQMIRNYLTSPCSVLIHGRVTFGIYTVFIYKG